MKLSACIIAKNEAENLPDCLQSLRTIVDEMIVVDTGSTDDTIRIAERFGAKVYEYGWQEDFSAAKNYALEKASGDWIVFLDADEYFADETIKNVRLVVTEHAQACDAYLVRMINVDRDDQYRQLDHFYAVRIFKNLPELRFFGKVHEELRFVDGRKKALYQVEPTDILLYHTGYSAQRIKLKCQRNLNILQEEMQRNPRNTDLYRYLADAYHGLGDFEHAVSYAKMDIETGRKELSYASRSYRIMNNALIKLQAPAAEIEYYLRKAIEAFPDLPDFYTQYALLKYNQQSYDDAFELLTKAMQLHASYCGLETSLFESKLSLTYLMMGLLQQRNHKSKEALEYYQQALTLDKYYPEAFTALFQLIHQQEAVYVIGFLNTLYNLQQNKDVQFLVDQIGMINKGKIHQYYCNQLNLLQGNAAKSGYNYEELRAATFLTIAIVLSGRFEKIKQIENLLPDAYKKILYRYGESSATALNEADFNTYKNIGLELLLTNDDKVMERYSELSRDFSKERMLEMAQLLLEKRRFLPAFQLYTYVLEQRMAVNLAMLYYQLGVCAYQLKKYEAGMQYFEKAVELGYQGNDVKEFLAWSVEKR